jgi:hypothetical protein
VEAAMDAFAAEGVQVIIGCDVLQRCLFQYLGPARQFVLAY